MPDAVPLTVPTVDGNPVGRAPGPTPHDPFAGPPIEAVRVPGGAQREVWLSAVQGSDASCAFNECIELAFPGPVEPATLQRALTRLAATHDSLRTTFSRSGERLVVRAAEPIECRVVRRDGGAGRAPGQGDGGTAVQCLDTLRRAEVSTPFDLEHGPLWRATLLPHDGDWRALLTFHHLIADGWSLAVILDDLARFHRAELGARPGPQAEGPPLPTPSFADYLRLRHEADRRGETAATLAWWQERLASPPAPLDLPCDRTRPPLRSFAAARLDIAIDPALMARTRHAAAAHGTTPFVWMLAAWFALLERLTGEADLVVGIPSAGQSDSGLDRLVGHCVNLLPLRQRVDPETRFAEFARQCRSGLFDAREHAGLTFGDLIATLGLPRDRSRVPLVATTFNIDQEARRLDFGTIAAGSSNGPAESTTYVSVPRLFDSFEWSVNIGITAERTVIECTFNTDLFDAANMHHRMDAFAALLDQVARRPEARIDELALWTPRDQRVLDALNDTARPAPDEADLASLLERSTGRHASRTALVAGEERCSYADLESRSEALAGALHAAGVTEADTVAIGIARGVPLVCLLYALRKLGAVCLPLDPNLPDERRAGMLADAGARFIVHDNASMEQAAGVSDTAPVALSLAGLLSHPPERSPDRPGTGPWPERRHDPGACAYLLYTSGSTGRPKGVRVSRANEVNLLRAMSVRPGIGRDDRLLAVTTVGFDIALPELFLPLLAGACTVIASRETATDPAALATALDVCRITVMQATPSTWRALVDDGWAGRAELVALCGGEPLPQRLVAELLPRTRALWNLYGPTETTVWSTAQRVSDAVAPVAIGQPLDNTRLHLLDARGRRVPIGSVGELWIGGAGVAIGYHDRATLTAERFVADRIDPDTGSPAGAPGEPGAPRAGERLYRTGDLCRLHADGRLEHLGRADDQVKLRGHRVELGEIETVLAGHPQVAVCVARVDVPADAGSRSTDRPASLNVWCRGDAGTPRAELPDAAELRRFARRSLPDYMVPDTYRWVDTLPLTANGKIDRRRLPMIVDDTPGSPTGSPTSSSTDPHEERPASDTERWIAERWAALGTDARASRQATFLELGGHSLMAMQFIRDAQQRFGVRMPLRGLLTDSLAELAATLNRQVRAAAPGQAPDTVPDSVSETVADAAPASASTRARARSDRQPRSELESMLIDAGDGRILCHHHRPRRPRPGVPAVLIAAPLGHEYLRSHHALQQLAVQLADAGRHVLRFDHRGSGDSSGDDHETSIEALDTDLLCASEHLTRLSDGSPLDVIGLRLGATLAARHATLSCEALVLIDPVPSGRGWFESLDRMHRSVRTDLNRFRWRRRDPDIGGERLGFRYPKSLRAGIERLELDTPPSVAHRSLHLLQSAGEPPLPGTTGTGSDAWPPDPPVRLTACWDWSVAGRIDHPVPSHGLVGVVDGLLRAGSGSADAVRANGANGDA